MSNNNIYVCRVEPEPNSKVKKKSNKTVSDHMRVLNGASYLERMKWNLRSEFLNSRAIANEVKIAVSCSSKHQHEDY